MWVGLAATRNEAKLFRLAHQLQAAPNPYLCTLVCRLSRQSRRSYALAASAADTLQRKPVPLEVTKEGGYVEGASNSLFKLEKVKKILQDEIRGDGTWIERVDEAILDLQARRRGILTVIGDVYAAPRDVVSALLQDPLADSAETRQALLNRHTDSNIDTFRIRQGESLQQEPGSLSLSSSWLHATGYDIVELNLRNLDLEPIVSRILKTDALLVVLDPIRLASTPQISPLLPYLLAKKYIHFVVNGKFPPGATPTNIEAALREQLKGVLIMPIENTYFDPSSIKISFTGAEEALAAFEALSNGLNNGNPSLLSRASAVETFQTKFTQSRIGPLQSTLCESLSTITLPQVATANETVALAVSHMIDVIVSDREMIRSATNTVSELVRTAQQGSADAKALGVVERDIDGGLVEGAIGYEMVKIKREIEASFRGRLSWLGLLGRLRVDDITLELGGIVGDRFAVDLERQLIFEAGQLAQLQTNLSLTSDKIVKLLSHQHSTRTSIHPFNSPLLANQLSTLSLSIPPLTPTTLLHPISTRRSQLLSLSLPRLQLSAQRTLLTTYSIAFCGASLSWVAYVPPVELFSAGTATGLGLLSIMGSLAAGQKLWERAQKSFWKDWKRVTRMLKGDLKAQLDTVISAQVMAKPSAAAQGLESLIEKRKKKLDVLQKEIDSISKL
nr:hypothetical protein L204_02627 [Cryptococcus depauperatus CBS 7855]